MKKFLIIIFSFFMFLNSFKALSANSYIVMDADTNGIIMGENIYDQRLVASTSKIMTAIIAIENGTLDDKVTADKDILKAVGSSIYIEVGETLTLKDLLYGLMLRSGNDAAVMIAKNISGDMENFTKLMNEYAKKLGMNKTLFYNAHGLEDSFGNGNLSTCYDMAILTSYAMQNETFREIFHTKNYVAKSQKKTYTWQNKNKLLKYDYITGGKTGYTLKAKRTLVTSASINDMNLIIVTLNDPDDWQDHINLYQKVKKNYQKFLIVDKDNFNIPSKELNIEKKFYIKNSYSMILQDNKDVEVKYYLYDANDYKDGDEVGYLKVYQNEKAIYEDKIYIKKRKLNWFLKLWYKLFGK